MASKVDLDHRAGLEEEYYRESDIEAILGVLENSQYWYRTARGISEDSGIPLERVQLTLDEQVCDRRQGLVRASPFRTMEGENIYASRAIPLHFQEKLEYLKRYLAK